MGSWWDAADGRGLDRRTARRRAADAGRGLWRIRARGHAAAARCFEPATSCASAPSPRPMAWRACGLAIASAMPSSSRPSTRSAIISASPAWARSPASRRWPIRTHLTIVVAKVAAAREEIAAIARANGLTPLPSATNFVTIDCGRDGDYARRVLDRAGGRGRLRAHAGRRAPEPLHPHHRGHAGGPADSGRGTAEGAEGRRLNHAHHRPFPPTPNAVIPAKAGTPAFHPHRRTPRRYRHATARPWHPCSADRQRRFPGKAGQ